MIAKLLLALAAVAAAALVTRWVCGALIPSMPVTRRNHRGIETPTGLGIAVLVGILGGAFLVAFVHAVAPDSTEPAVALLAFIGIGLLGFAFGAVGLYDDIAAQQERGWRAHVPALLRGKLTPGGLKMLAGGAIAFVFGAATATSFGWAIVDAAIIALMANVFNALDVRPGRACKAYIVGAIPLAILGHALTVPLSATLGAVAAFALFDLRERAMMGDAGSNAIGAILGGAVVEVHPASWFRIALLVFLVALTAVAEGPTLSAWIDRIGPLRALDRAWRTNTSEVLDRDPGQG